MSAAALLAVRGSMWARKSISRKRFVRIASAVRQSAARWGGNGSPWAVEVTTRRAKGLGGGWGPKAYKPLALSSRPVKPPHPSGR